jgi:hypothetical protein
MEIENEKRTDSSAVLLGQVTGAPKDKVYRIFCEKHRPLKIVKEIEERDVATIEEIQRFCKIIDRCMEIDMKAQMRPVNHRLERKKELERR